MSTPLHQSNELVFQMSPYPHKISEDLVLGHASLDVTVSDNIIKKGKNRQPKLVAGGGSENSCSMNSKSGSEKKKEILMKHREIERLRRQEMAALYASLRSLLPLELIKGKRSVSDHIMEAVNYIKLQEKKMEKLRGARDELKKLSKSTACTEHESESGSPSRSTVRTPASRVVVQPFSSGVEIIISSSSRERGLPLSRVLDVLLQQGLSIVHCVSTTLNDQLHHTIHSDFEVNNLETINLSSLEKKLTEAISSS